MRVLDSTFSEKHNKKGLKKTQPNDVRARSAHAAAIKVLVKPKVVKPKMPKGPSCKLNHLAFIAHLKLRKQIRSYMAKGCRLCQPKSKVQTKGKGHSSSSGFQRCRCPCPRINGDVDIMSEDSNSTVEMSLEQSSEKPCTFSGSKQGREAKSMLLMELQGLIFTFLVESEEPELQAKATVLPG
ncbi:hypothetical protein A6R68_07304, partial [Neotoma lepida]